MGRRSSMIVAILALPGLLGLAGCVQHEDGWATGYRPDHADKIPVVMPQGAPSISQQFFRDRSGYGHRGIDIVGRIGSPVIAAASGQVIDSYFEPAYGNRVTIDHGPNSAGLRTLTVYKHLNSRTVSAGEWVERGQYIATLGNTGGLAGGIPHLHFEIQREVRPKVTRAVDPHTMWVNGVGQVSCFDPASSYDSADFGATYPVPCN